MKRTLLLLIILYGFLSACSNNHRKLVQAEDLSNQLMTLWETGDDSGIDHIFSPEASYTDMANNHTFHGIAEISSYVQHIHSWGSDIQMQINNMQLADSHAYIEWTLTAKQSKPIGTMVTVATHKSITLNGVSLIEIKAGKIIKATDYMDVLGFILQLGSEVKLPGSSTD